jgi:acetylornithine deacetylase
MSERTLSAALEHLEHLVGFDTQNPPRQIDGGGLFAYCKAQLPGFRVEVRDLGEGQVWLYAERGAPKALVNVHMDTVPAAEGYSRDPHRLHVQGGRAYGLGTADIKGAAACLLAVAQETTGPAAFLFSSDEEAGQSLCVRDFLERCSYAEVLVAEPTGCQAVLAHRGIGTATLAFSGTPGHASAPRALADSAVHEAVRWAARALEKAEEEARVPAAEGELVGLRMNLGVFEGGQKSNMIAGSARVRVGVRPPPGRAPLAVLEELRALAPHAERVRLEAGFLAPPLPAPGHDDVAARVLAERLGLPLSLPVDFWTEASLFSQAGAAALVFGPGHIAQAHSADEFVELEQLALACAAYRRLVEGS